MKRPILPSKLLSRTLNTNYFLLIFFLTFLLKIDSLFLGNEKDAKLQLLMVHLEVQTSMFSSCFLQAFAAKRHPITVLLCVSTISYYINNISFPASTVNNFMTYPAQATFRKDNVYHSQVKNSFYSVSTEQRLEIKIRHITLFCVVFFIYSGYFLLFFL